MISTDLRIVFYSVPVAVHHQNYLKIFANQNLESTCMPNGMVLWSCHESL